MTDEEIHVLQDYHMLLERIGFRRESIEEYNARTLVSRLSTGDRLHICFEADYDMCLRVHRVGCYISSYEQYRATFDKGSNLLISSYKSSVDIVPFLRYIVMGHALPVVREVL